MTASGAWLAGPALALVAGALWALRRSLLVVTVQGTSMLPTYPDGARILVRRRRSALRVREVVVADVTGYRLQVWPGGGGPPMPSERVVKRVAAVAGDVMPDGVHGCRSRVPAGRVVLLSDNPEGSTDSRHYGAVEAGRVLGVVLRRLS